MKLLDVVIALNHIINNLLSEFKVLADLIWRADLMIVGFNI